MVSVRRICSNAAVKSNMDIKCTVLKLIKLTIFTGFTPARLRLNVAYKPVQNSQKPHDALYKAHHAVFESFEPVRTPYPPKTAIPTRFVSHSFPVPVSILLVSVL